MAVGWLLIAVPALLSGVQILRIPVVLVGILGAAAGVAVMLLPTAFLWALSRGREHFSLDWAYLSGWPAFAAAIGAIGLVVYRQLLSRLLSPGKA